MTRQTVTEVFATALVLCLAPSAQADVVTDWNQVAREMLIADVIQQHPGEASRSMAMTHVAIYDSFQMTTLGGTTYYDYSGQIAPPASGTSREAAAVQAAYTVLSNNYPGQQSILNMRLQDSLGMIPNSQAKTDGIALGTAIGNSIVSRRANDGYDANVQYVPSGLPGRWEPDPLNPGQEAWGPVWGEVTPFSLTSGSQFTAPPMPALDSPEYAASFNEVKALGALNGTRTQEQTDIGIYWAYDRLGLGTPMVLFNQILETISVQELNTPEQNAELFARATVAMVDAGIASWVSKYDYDFWRPVSAIRRADEDGNPATIADSNWIPLGSPGDNPNSTSDDFTPPFPTYVSGHATFGGALFKTLEEFYGTDNIAFTFESDEMPGEPRSFNTFSEAMVENGRSRVYLGVHFDFDDLRGQDLGMDVANYIASRPFIAAVPEPSGLIAGGFGLFFLLRRHRPRK